MTGVVVITPDELRALIRDEVRKAFDWAGPGSGCSPDGLPVSGWVRLDTAAKLRGCSKSTFITMLNNGEIPDWAIERRGSRNRYHVGWCRGQARP